MTTPHVLLVGRIAAGSSFVRELTARAKVSWLAPAAAARHATDAGFHTVVSVHSDATPETWAAYSRLVAMRTPVTAVHPGTAEDMAATAHVAGVLGLPLAWGGSPDAGTHAVLVHHGHAGTSLGMALRLHHGPDGQVLAVSGPEPLPAPARAVLGKAAAELAAPLLGTIGLCSGPAGWEVRGVQPLLPGHAVGEILRHGCDVDPELATAELLADGGFARELPEPMFPGIAVADAGVPREGVLVALEGVAEAAAQPDVLAAAPVQTIGSRVRSAADGEQVARVVASGTDPRDALARALRHVREIRPVIDLPPSLAGALDDMWVARVRRKP